MMPASVIVSNASSTPALTIATIRMPWSKYSCSVISSSPAGVFSNGVSAVSARQPSSCSSSLPQSAIMVLLNVPSMMSSWCFL